MNKIKLLDPNENEKDETPNTNTQNGKEILPNGLLYPMSLGLSYSNNVIEQIKKFVNNIYIMNHCTNILRLDMCMDNIKSKKFCDINDTQNIKNIKTNKNTCFFICFNIFNILSIIYITKY